MANPRIRDPERKARILAAAARLGSRRGFHAISMTDIGAEAGIVGSGIYRHFDSKTAILVAMLDQVMDGLTERTARIVAAGGSDAETLSELVKDHVQVALRDRDVLAVYHFELHTLPEAARRRLRRAQRHYVEDWVHPLATLRPDLADAELRLTVHAALATIQSCLFFHSGLPEDRLAVLLETMAHGCMGTVSELQITNP